MTEAARRAQGAAFDLHVVPHIEVLLRVALSLTRHPTDAEDLVQDTLLRAYLAVDRFDGAHPRAWLLTILRNTHANRNRRRRPVLLCGDDTADALERLTPCSPASEDVVINTEFEAVVSEALAALSDQHRSVIALVDIDGLSYQEAADALGVPRGTVMSRLHRARSRIRARLDVTGTAPRRRGM